jgi:hypothetical protein
MSETPFSLPTSRNDGYARWVIPTDAWNEDTIIIQREPDGRWIGRTEFDQCVKRDLDEDEIAAIRAEYGLRLT